MKKSEVEFLRILEEKAKEQRKVVQSQILPSWARGLGVWLAVHPWRVIGPLSGILYIGWRVIGGVRVVELVLGLFGGFR